MVGRLIEQQDVWPLNQAFGNREALAPASRQGRRRSVQFREARAAKRLGKSRRSLRIRYFRSFESALDHGTHSRAGGKLRNLRNATQARALADRHLSSVRLYAAVEDLEQCRFARSIRADQADPFAFGN